MTPDIEARRTAATDFTRNLVVRAGAGTGKTSLLVERLLVALGQGKATMEQIAAITFTEKAAGELRQRLSRGLGRLLALCREEVDPQVAEEADRAHGFLTVEAWVPPPRIAERALAAMEALDRATVLTIHGFCAELLRSHPIEAGVDPAFVVDSGEKEESLGRDAWDAFLAHELGHEAQRVPLWRSLLPHVSAGRLGIVARQLARFDIPGDALEAAPDVALTLLREEAGGIADRIESLQERQSGLSPLPRRYFEYAREALRAMAEGGSGAFRRQLDTDPSMLARILDGKVPSLNPKLSGVSREEAKEVRRNSRDLIKALLTIDDEQVAGVIETVLPFVRDSRESFLARGLVSFDGLLALARDLLRDCPEVRRALQRRFRLLLVDEFQDTDPLQYEIVLFLAEQTDSSADDAYTARLEPGRLFVVGDAKQSIYRFRGADYSAYRRAVAHIVSQGGAELNLVGNFRSIAGIVEPVNRLFSDPGGSWAGSDWQPDYAPITAVREEPTDESPAVELWTVPSAPSARADDRRLAEGRAVAHEIRRRVEVDGSCQYRQIAILFRAFTNITDYLRPLRQWGIPFVVDGGREFLRRPEVEQLLATLRALSQPSDPAALLAFLRSPAGGVSDVELAEYAGDGGRWNWREEPEDSRFAEIARCFRLLRELRDETRHRPADAVIRRVLDRTHQLPLAAAAFEGAQRVANLRKLASAAGDLAREGRLSLEEVVEALEQGRLEDIKTDRPLADDAANAVRITSIHRMKGLENDLIFVPDLARAERGHWFVDDRAKLARLPDGSVTVAVRSAGMANTAAVWLDLQDRRHGDAEEVRVLYVGLTRARERLVLLVSPQRTPPSWVRALGVWGYRPDAPPPDGALLADGRVLHRVCRPEEMQPPTEDVDEPTTAVAVTRYRESVGRLRETAVAPFRSPSGLHEERERRWAGERVDASARGGGRELGKGVGIALHRWLEIGAGASLRESRRHLPALCREAARELQLDPDEVEASAVEIADRFLASELGAELSRIDPIGREVPLLLRDDDGRVYRGSIDLLYRDEAGRYVVADYKTDREGGDAELRERYAGQLAVYAAAVHRAMGLDQPPGTELWLLREGRRLVL